MTGKRTRYSAEFKAEVVLEAIRGEMTVAQLAAKHGIHRTMINAWKKQAVEGMAEVLRAKPRRPGANQEAEIEHFHIKPGNWSWNGIFKNVNQQTLTTMGLSQCSTVFLKERNC